MPNYTATDIPEAYHKLMFDKPVEWAEHGYSLGECECEGCSP